MLVRLGKRASPHHPTPSLNPNHSQNLRGPQFGAVHNQAGQGPDHGRGHAPVDQLAVGDLEGRAVERAHDHIPDDIRALAHGRTNVGAQVT